jgi:hypothetical protein
LRLEEKNPKKGRREGAQTSFLPRLGHSALEATKKMKKGGATSFFAESDALLSSLLDPLEGLSMVNCEKLELGGAPDFQH